MKRRSAAANRLFIHIPEGDSSGCGATDKAGSADDLQTRTWGGAKSTAADPDGNLNAFHARRRPMPPDLSLGKARLVAGATSHPGRPGHLREGEC